jgi:hypothetical protein
MAENPFSNRKTPPGRAALGALFAGERLKVKQNSGF